MARLILKLFMVYILLTGLFQVSKATSAVQKKSFENNCSEPTSCTDELQNSNTSRITKDFPSNKTISKNRSSIIKVTPSSGSNTGSCNDNSYFVKISGGNFGNGWDITNVTLCGVEVCQIVMQSSDIVIVYPGAGTPGTGDVVITSASKGKTIIEKAFTYENLTPSKESKNSKYSAVSESANKTR